VVKLLRKMSTGEVGTRPRQVIITTHNPILLNYVAPEEVRIFRRDAEMATTITPMSQVPNIQNYLREFSTGELWNMLGEEALVTGAGV
jgi:hypothetical protein